jgi:hypothetical protein
VALGQVDDNSSSTTYSSNGGSYQQSLSYDTSVNYQSNLQNQNSLQPKIAALGSTADASIFMPVLFGVSVKDLTPNFGEMRSTGRPHAGEDIMAIKGTPIVSPTAAVVLRVTTDLTSSEGNAVYTANPGGETFVYYHLSKIGEGVVPGLVLAQGSLVGYVGDTGSAKGTPHLHLEIRDSAGVATNPFTRLTIEFTPTQKISFLTIILTQTSDPVSLSQFLVTNFRSTFTTDIQDGITLPSLITNALATVPAAPATASNIPDGDLMIGSSGPAVTSLQQFLSTSTTFYQGEINGYFGPITEAALMEYQTSKGIIPADGYYGPATRAVVEAAIASVSAQTNNTANSNVSKQQLIDQLNQQLASLINQVIQILQAKIAATIASGK